MYIVLLLLLCYVTGGIASLSDSCSSRPPQLGPGHWRALRPGGCGPSRGSPGGLVWAAMLFSFLQTAAGGMGGLFCTPDVGPPRSTVDKYRTSSLAGHFVSQPPAERCSASAPRCVSMRRDERNTALALWTFKTKFCNIFHFSARSDLSASEHR